LVLSPCAEHSQNVCTSTHEGFGTENTAKEKEKKGLIMVSGIRFNKLRDKQV
jgi:hypothetical protein